MLARTAQLEVCVSRVGAYPSGFELELPTIGCDQADELDPLLLGGRRLHRSRRAGRHAIADEMLRFGIEVADGKKVTNTAERPIVNRDGRTSTMHWIAADDSNESPEPAEPVLSTGAQHRWWQRRWRQLETEHLDLAAAAPGATHVRLPVARRGHPADPP